MPAMLQPQTFKVAEVAEIDNYRLYKYRLYMYNHQFMQIRTMEIYGYSCTTHARHVNLLHPHRQVHASSTSCSHSVAASMRSSTVNIIGSNRSWNTQEESRTLLICRFPTYSSTR
jgi:hypothetical protein